MNAWKDNLRQIEPYVPGEQPDFPQMIKLNTNENPYPPCPGVLRAIRSTDAERMRLYPSTTGDTLAKALSAFYCVPEEKLFIGVGSDDVLATSFLAFFNSEKPILFPELTYSFYEVWAKLYRIPYQTIPLPADYRILPEKYRITNGGIVIANPNAPTSVCEPVSVIEDIIRNNPDSVVVVDEAYIDFGGESCLPLIEKYENLLVVQTFSKARSMAGMRIGFAIGSETLIRCLNDIKFSINSYTMNYASLIYGTEAVLDVTYFRETLQKVITTREWFKEQMKHLGFLFPDSMTNFLFVTHPRYHARDLFTAMRKDNIFVRHFEKPALDNHLRITIGTQEEMQKVVNWLYNYMK